MYPEILAFIVIPSPSCARTYGLRLFHATLLIPRQISPYPPRKVRPEPEQISFSMGTEFGTDDDPPGLKKRDSKT